MTPGSSTPVVVKLTPTPRPPTPRRLDLVGLALSGSCLLHCLALPVALLAAPSLAVWLGETESTVHWLLFVVAVVVSGGALYTGYRRHGAALVVGVGVVGLLVMGVAAAHLFGSSLEAALTLAGASIVALAHVVNLRLCPSRAACTGAPAESGHP